MQRVGICITLPRWTTNACGELECEYNAAVDEYNKHAALRDAVFEAETTALYEETRLMRVAVGGLVNGNAGQMRHAIAAARTWLDAVRTRHPQSDTHALCLASPCQEQQTPQQEQQ